jgi:hypothetical protein
LRGQVIFRRAQREVSNPPPLRLDAAHRQCCNGCMARKSSAKKSTRATRRAASRKRVRRIEADVRAEKVLIQLARSVKRNSPIIRERLRKAGVEPNPSLVFATAMYFDALDRLAKE